MSKVKFQAIHFIPNSFKVFSAKAVDLLFELKGKSGTLTLDELVQGVSFGSYQNLFHFYLDLLKDTYIIYQNI